MQTPRFFVFTGANSGLGLEAVRKLAHLEDSAIIIVGARNPEGCEELRSAIPSSRLQLLTLDASSIGSVQSFAAQVLEVIGSAKIAGIALNAGVQITDGDRTSVDGYEMTFATNVLGHMVLFEALEAAFDPSTIVVSTASGTHDSEHKLAAPYGFKGGVFPSAEAIAQGNVSDSSDAAQAGRDRYSTSKLCNIMFTYAGARKFGDQGPRFVAYDPGLMPGTGLARTQPLPIRLAWKFLLPMAVRFIDGASTPARSGGELARILAGQSHPSGTGLHVEFTGEAIPSSQLSHDIAKQDELLAWVRGVKSEHQGANLH